MSYQYCLVHEAVLDRLLGEHLIGEWVYFKRDSWTIGGVHVSNWNWNCVCCD